MWNTGGPNTELTRNDMAMRFATGTGLTEAQAKIITSPPLNGSDSETEVAENLIVTASPKPKRSETDKGMCVCAFSHVACIHAHTHIVFAPFRAPNRRKSR
jgi:hypothetical protein